MLTALEIVEQLTPKQRVAMLVRIDREIPWVNPEGAPEAVTEIANHSDEHPDVVLPPAESVEASRTLLELLAKDPATAPLVVQSWQEIEKDDSLFIETVIALGLLANVTLFLASADIEFKVGGLKVRKPPATPEIIKAVTELVNKISLAA